MCTFGGLGVSQSLHVRCMSSRLIRHNKGNENDGDTTPLAFHDNAGPPRHRATGGHFDVFDVSFHDASSLRRKQRHQDVNGQT